MKLALGKTDEGFNIYKLTIDDVNSLIPAEYRKQYYEDYRELPTGIDTVEAYSTLNCNDTSETDIVLCFTFSIDSYEAPGAIGSIIVLDKMGRMISKINNINTGVYDPAISDNGKYLTVNYGFSIEGDEFMPSGFRVYEVSTGKIIVDRKPEGSLGIPFVVGDLIINGTSYFDDETRISRYYVFDTEKKTLFSRSYDSGRLQFIKEITKDGIIFKEPGSSQTIDYFESNFQKENLQ